MANKGKVVFQADTGQFVADVGNATDAVMAQAEAVAEAKNRIIASTNAKIEAAKREGASTKELIQLATQGAERSASVTERNASRIISSMDRVQEKAKETQSVLNQVKFDTEGAGEHSVTNQQKISALVRGGGVRSAENFLTQFDGVNKLAGVVFPVLGAAQLAKELFHVGEAAKEAYDRAKELPEAIRGAFESLNSPLQLSVDNLRKTNDELEITNAHLHGGSAAKPIAALEIDMIRIAADNAAESSRKAYLDVKKLLDENKSGAWQRLLDQGDTSDISAKINEQMKARADLDREHNRNIHDGKSDDGERAEYERRKKALDDDRRKYIANTREKINHSYVDDVHTSASGVTSIQRMTYAQRYGDQSKVNNILDGYEDLTNNQDDLDSERKRNEQVTADNKRMQDAKDRASAAKSAASKAAAEARKAKEDEIRAVHTLWQQEDDDLRNAGDVTAEIEVAAWVQRIAALKRGSAGYAEELATAEKNLSEAKAKARKEDEAAQKQRGELTDRGQMQTFGEQRNDAQANGATPQALKQLAEIQLMMANSANRMAAQKALDDATKAAQRYADAAAKASDKAKQAAAEEASAYQLAATSQAEQTGQMSKYDAATERANVHSQQYATTLATLKKALAEAQLRDLNGADAINAQAALDKAAADRKVQTMQDAAEMAAQTWQGALKNANAVWIQDSRNSAKQVEELFQQTMDGINGDIVNALTEKHHHGDHAIRNSFGETAKGISKTLANDGLKRAESGIMGALGLGKADGSKTNPFHVIMDGGGALGSAGADHGLSGVLGALGKGKGDDDDADDSSGSSSGFGGFLQKGLGFLTSLLGGSPTEHRALGGPVKAGHTYDINEAGMEGFLSSNGRTSFTAPTDGYIVPHDQLGGNSASYTINVANGVTPAETDMRVQSALRAVHGPMMRDAVRANRDAQARVPRGTRR